MVTAAQKLTLDGRELFVFDEIIAMRDHRELALSLERLPYTRLQVDTKATVHRYRYWSAHLELATIRRQLVYERIAALLDEHFAEEKLRLDRAYVNQNSYGDMTFIHTDGGARQRDVTALYFAHARWRTEWGGETLFFDRRADARFAVSPTPRRLVLFRGSIKHRIGVPTRQCSVTRLSLVFKFKRA